MNWLKGYLERRKAKRELHSLSDRELRDLGLSRCNIDRVIDIEYQHKKNKRKRK